MILWLRARSDEARVAMMFLTRLPVGRVERIIPVAATAWAWPLAGAVLGAIFAAVYTGAAAIGLVQPVAVVLAMAGALLVSGGFHEDGLADLADGIGGGADPARRLEIMRDSRLGSYGAMALIFAFGTGFLLWSRMAPHGIWAAAVAVGAVSRMALPLWLGVFAPARKDGLGYSASQQVSGIRIGVSLLFGVAFAMPVMAWSAVVACLGVQLAVCLYARRVIGGVTGDVLGASQVLGALAMLIVLGGY